LDKTEMMELGSLNVKHFDKNKKLKYEFESERKNLPEGGAEVTKKERKLNQSTKKLGAWKKLNPAPKTVK